VLGAALAALALGICIGAFYFGGTEKPVPAAKAPPVERPFALRLDYSLPQPGPRVSPPGK
jgi:hypothetical protein